MCKNEFVEFVNERINYVFELNGINDNTANVAIFRVMAAQLMDDAKNWAFDMADEEDLDDDDDEDDEDPVIDEQYIRRVYGHCRRAIIYLKSNPDKTIPYTTSNPKGYYKFKKALKTVCTELGESPELADRLTMDYYDFTISDDECN